MKNFIHKLLLFYRPYRLQILTDINKGLLELSATTPIGAAAKVEMAQNLQDQGYIRSPDDYFYFLNGEV